MLDTASRRGYWGSPLGEHHDTALACGALVIMAVAVRGGPAPGVVLHTARAANTPPSRPPASGCRSPSRRAARPLDHVVIESWRSTLEFELHRVGYEW